MNKLKNAAFAFTLLLSVIYLGALGWYLQLQYDQNNIQKRIATSFLFPLQTTKSAIHNGAELNGRVLKWDEALISSYHHSYPAADIHVRPGTKVLAARSGKVAKINNPAVCSVSNFPYVLVEGIDGLSYLYSHLAPGSIPVKEGELIERSVVIGEVGKSACAQNTAPHLHFDISRFQNFRGVGLGRLFMVDPQPLLSRSFNELP